MIYMVDEKDVAVLQDRKMPESISNEIHVFVKDMEKPSFTGNTVAMLLNFADEAHIFFDKAATKEEIAFFVGGKVMSGEEVTLIHMSIPIPPEFQKSVVVVEEKKTQRKTTKRTTAKRPAAKTKTVPLKQEPVDVESEQKSVMNEPVSGTEEESYTAESM